MLLIILLIISKVFVAKSTSGIPRLASSSQLLQQTVLLIHKQFVTQDDKRENLNVYSLWKTYDTVKARKILDKNRNCL